MWLGGWILMINKGLLFDVCTPFKPMLLGQFCSYWCTQGIEVTTDGYGVDVMRRCVARRSNIQT
jgi:hypothetical protein